MVDVFFTKQQKLIAPFPCLSLMWFSLYHSKEEQAQGNVSVSSFLMMTSKIIIISSISIMVCKQLEGA
jgi:hypothetical protein